MYRNSSASTALCPTIVVSSWFKIRINRNDTKDTMTTGTRLKRR